MLGKAATKIVHRAIDNLFDRMKIKLLGPQSVDKRIVVGYDHQLSLPGLYENAARDEGAAPNQTSLEALLSVAGGYLDAQRERTKAQVTHDVNAFLSEAKAKGVDTDVQTVLGGQLAETFEKVTSDVHRIVDSEAQNGRALGTLEGIVKINAQSGIDDPTMYFVIVRDDHVCNECIRLHLLDDKVTPRVWKLSEIGHGYHKRGDESPKLGGLHPHCRCSPATLMPGYGFNGAGMVTYISPGHRELERQRGLEKKEPLDQMIERLHKHQHEGCSVSLDAFVATI